MASVKSGSNFKPDSDVHISFEDQQKINRFARLNAKMDDHLEELRVKQGELRNLDDACSELELFDDDVKIPYHVGEIFLGQDLSTTMENLEDSKVKKRAEIKDLEHKCTALKELMSDLKTQLYAKFGIHINLEAGDD